MVHPTTFDQWCGEWGAGSFSLPQFWLRLLQLSAKRFHQAGPPMPKSPRELEELRAELLTGMNSNRSCEGTKSERLHRTKVFTLCKKAIALWGFPSVASSLSSCFFLLPLPLSSSLFHFLYHFSPSLFHTSFSHSQMILVWNPRFIFVFLAHYK